MEERREIKPQSMQFYVNQLRAGNVLAFLDNAKFINEKYGSHLKLGAEEYNQLFLYELAQTDINENDLKILFNFQLLLEDLEKQNEYLAMLSRAFVTQTVYQRMESLIIHKKLNANVFNEIKEFKINNNGDLEKFEDVLIKNKLDKDSIYAFKSEIGIPRSQGIDDYKSQENYREFASQQAIPLLRYFIEKKEGNFSQTVQEELENMINQKQQKQSFFTRVASYSSNLFATETPIKNYNLALSHLLNLCSYTKMLYKSKDLEKSLPYFRKIEEILISEKTYPTKQSIDLKQINKWKKEIINKLIKVIDPKEKSLVANLKKLPIDTDEFLDGLKKIMESHHSFRK